ncbi:MAG TPA: hypothetical protein VFA20_09460 [Myxococcaceae bacterium]|nr:hypothetical protein [Myxococcaceae bacterium]
MIGRIGLVAALAFTACAGSNQQPAGACEPASYTACGCGCCGGATPVERCVDVAGGETMRQIIDADRQVAQNANCSMAGCSLPVHYTCCPGR